MRGKKRLPFFMMILVMFSLAGCGAQEKKQASERIQIETNVSKDADQWITTRNNKHN